MALGFSSGLLTGLQQYGQGGGVPSDPRQRNAMQAAGVTNPLLQQFGMGLGGLIGNDMRSPMDQFSSALQNIDTSTPEGKKSLITALAKVDPISAVKMGEAFRQEALDAPKRAADLARIEAQTELAKRQAEFRNISFVKEVETADPLTGQITKKPQQFTVTVDSEGKIPEAVLEKYGTIGISQEDVDTAVEQETIEYFIDDKGKQKKVLYKDGKTYDVTSGDDPVEIAPETVEDWRGVGQIKTQPTLPEEPPAPVPASAPAQPTTQRAGQILGGNQGMLTNPIFAPYVNR